MKITKRKRKKEDEGRWEGIEKREMRIRTIERENKKETIVKIEKIREKRGSKKRRIKKRQRCEE